jgi:hypothetical protein
MVALELAYGLSVCLLVRAELKKSEKKAIYAKSLIMPKGKGIVVGTDFFDLMRIFV